MFDFVNTSQHHERMSRIITGDATDPMPPQMVDNVLNDLMQRTGVMDHLTGGTSGAPFARWNFVELGGANADVLEACAPQMEFLKSFKNSWGPKAPGKFYFPEDWKPKETDLNLFKNRTGSLARCEMEVLVRHAGDAFIVLSHADAVARHDDPTSFEPDFFLSVPSHHVNQVRHKWKYPVDETLCLDAEHSLEHFKPVVFYAGDEREAEAVITGAFLCTPGCWMRCNPMYRFPPQMMGSNQGQLSDFSFLLHPIGPAREFGMRRDSCLRVTLINPALVVGVKGPILWNDMLAHPSSIKRPKDFNEAIRDLATAVQPSLDTHLLNLQLRREQMPEKSHSELMPWFMMFGIIYDAERIVVVAHIPYMPLQGGSVSDKPGEPSQHHHSYISCVVDSIPFPSMSPHSERSKSQWWVNRFRAAYALFSLQKHAFRLASLWESVVWPPDIALAEAEVEREHLGPTPTTSEHGDDPPSYDLDLEEEPMLSWEQQEELDQEIEERDRRAQEILPDLLEWVQEVE